MKFLRRHDLDPHTSIEMVKLAWLHQGIYGKMTQIAQDYHISRTFLYQLTWAAQHQLETLFAQFIAICRRSKWSKHLTNSPFLALLAMAGSNAACKISSVCSNAFRSRKFRRN